MTLMDLAAQPDLEPEATIDLTERDRPQALEAPDSPPVAPADATDAVAEAATERVLELGVALLGRIHPDDQERMVAAVATAPHHRDDFILRMQDDAGAWVEVRCSLVPITSEEPRPRR